MQLQHVEAAGLAAQASSDELLLDAVHRGAIHFARHLAVGEVRQWRRRDRVPAALLQRPVHALPHQLGRALAAGMAKLQADFGGGIGVDEINDARPRGLLLVVPQASTARRDAGVAADAGHLGEDQPGAADGARAIMHQMEITGHALLRRVHAHRRHHRAIRNLHLAQLERLEHRRHRLVDIDIEALGAHLFCKSLVDLADEFRRAQREVIVSDRLGAGHDAEGELHGIEIPEAVDMFEPDQRHVGGVLGLLDLLAPAMLIGLQCALDRRRLRHRIGKRDRVLHRELGAGADREMRRGLGVAKQHHVVLDPALAADHREIAPHRAVDQQRMTVEEPAENLGHAVGGLLLAQAFEPGALEGFGIGLENPGRASRLVLICVRDERTPLRLLEDEGEGIERFGRAHPGELVGAQVDLGLEVFNVFVAEAAVDAVGQHDQVGIGKSRFVVDIGFEQQRHAEFAGAFLQDQQQRPPRAAAKTVAADAVDGAAEMHGDIVPIGEFLGDAAVARRIVFLEIVQRRVREHHPEAERVVGAVALIDRDLGLGPLFLQEDRGVETGRSAADNRDLHLPPPKQAVGQVRNYFKPKIILGQGGLVGP